MNIGQFRDAKLIYNLAISDPIVALAPVFSECGNDVSSPYYLFTMICLTITPKVNYFVVLSITVCVPTRHVPWWTFKCSSHSEVYAAQI